MSLYVLRIDEEERQTLVLALAILVLERPGLEPAHVRPLVLREFDPDGALFDSLKRSNADRVDRLRSLAAPDVPL